MNDFSFLHPPVAMEPLSLSYPLTSPPVSYPHTSPHFPEVSSSQTQTDLGKDQLEELENVVSSDIALRDVRIQDLSSQVRVVQAREEEQKITLERCSGVVKQLLVEKSTMEKKKARLESMANRIRLGEFKTQRVGIEFQEVWMDGHGFSDLTKRQEDIAQEKEEIDRKRKLLAKRKPHGVEKEQAGTSKNSGTPNAKKRRITGSEGGTPNGKKSPTDAINQAINNNNKHLETLLDAPNQNELLTAQDYYIAEEILRLKQFHYKKEDSEIILEYEKLERERNVHIRELKRIQVEDQSKWNDFPILNDRYLLLMLVGKGGFSEVYKGFDLKENKYVACKLHQLNSDWADNKKANYIKHALREYNIHKSLHHPRIVSLNDVFEICGNSFCTVLEFCDVHDLDFLLKQNKMIPEKEARSIIMQVVSALKYLNEIKPAIIHYDLKPGNILLTGGDGFSGDVKITDFGLSKIMDDEHYNPDHGMDLTSPGAGTYWYLPPECFQIGPNPPKISSKVDVWSLGVLFYQCLYGKKPFGHNKSQAAILSNNIILNATEVEFPPKPAVSEDAKQFIRKCLKYRKEERLNVLEMSAESYLGPPVRKTQKLQSEDRIEAHGSHQPTSVTIKPIYTNL